MAEHAANPGDKVVSLNAHRQLSNPQVLADLPEPIRRLHERAEGWLEPLLRLVLDRADDAFFERAEAAGSNQDQQIYFDAMREVRLRRKVLSQRFTQELLQGFGGLKTHPKDDFDSDLPGIDELSLMDTDTLEEQVAIETMARKAADRYSEAIQLLSIRMDHLSASKVGVASNPLGPDFLSQSFAKATADIKLSIGARLVLFKLFDQCFLGQMETCYREANQLLIDAGIMPDLKLQRRNRPVYRPVADTGHRAPGITSGGMNELEESAEQAPEEVLNLLKNWLNSAPSGRPAAGSVAGGVLASDQILPLLADVQQAQQLAEQPLAPAQVGALVRHQVQSRQQQSLSSVDDNVINLVSMLFEFILDDRNLAAPMKAMLSRLQIPMIKVAIADKSFLAKSLHPARQLLNEMARAAIGWQEPEDINKDNLYQLISELVQRVLGEFEDDVSLFDDLLADLRRYMNKDAHRARIMEQRLVDAEQGKAKAERAQAESERALARITRDKVLPPATHTLLSEHWSRVLYLTCLSQGSDSESWREQQQTAYKLAWSLTAEADAENRDRVRKLLPGLNKALREGLQSVGMNPHAMAEQLKAINAELHSHWRDVKKVAEPEPEIETEAVAEAPVEVEQVEAVIAQELEALPEVEPEVVQEAESAEDVLPENDPHWSLVANMTQGSWFEMHDAEGQHYRCRLAAIIRATGKYIFVNRSGMKVAEETRESLALALKQRRMQVLDDGMLFDRALESVIGSLRQTRR
ncbi:DUF1631 domain-containing protein [Marinimicrobium alkaliphilum]|uniref:DUF1631 domain-containing protein n=1 Tax=Marinimicrobium alkaliphilum TaxID=2202654 RepID=UPI000DBABD6E|nr:DUF1631 domain-containing protein [Marinimicrobium alkaliphilum]